MVAKWCRSILSMGYLTEFPVMDAKRAFCHGSTGNLTNQLIVNDHMMSHYKKIYSAKAAVDCSIPKSMCRNVKYIDQKRREQLKKDMPERSQSVKSLSQRSIRLNTMTPCSSKTTRPYVRGEERSHFNLGSSVMSSPRFNTSFHCKQIVYSSQMTTSSQNCRPASELSYRHHYTPSCTTSAIQNKFKSFQDPTQKTYSGDILLKHAHRFTQEKPFTPRTLKSNCKSTLSTYRYYTPPSRKGTEEKISSKLHHQDTYHGSLNLCSTHSKRESSEGQDSPQPYSLEHEWSDEESNAFGNYSTASKFRDSDFLLTSSRVSPEGMRSPTMRKVTAEEEELMYLEFITDVTNEIIARGIYSDRVLGRVFKRHIDMNKHRLDEVKMRHLLDVLQNDLQSPPAAPVMALEKKNQGSPLLPRHKYSSLGHNLTLMTTDDTSLLPHTLLDKTTEELTLMTTDDTSLLPCIPLDKDTKELGAMSSVHSPTVSPVSCVSGRAESKGDKKARQEDEKDNMDLELDHKEKNAVSSSLDNYEMSKEGYLQNCTANDELVKQIDELGRNVAESLTVSETHGPQEFTEQDSAVKLSDDEF